MNKELSDMGELFGSELRFVESMLDVETMMTAYIHLAHEVSKHNDVASLFSVDHGSKNKCKVLLKSLPVSQGQLDESDRFDEPVVT
ncbi:hypothetical protein P3T76_005296 [Phytophthora citrophthora]|uniref:Uncharacterized protein n=1 Tax=Phytophthora citrophthora TaxID=4793 RepID=A0AAD9GSD6_9STRA|nr:hypothetical protein P3T76_005296 [Phytophthora citrophthora]